MTQAPSLTPRRLFSDPPLTVAVPQKPTFVEHADGHSVVFLHNRADQREVLDLWRWDAADEQARSWLRSEDLTDLIVGSAQQESETELAERERLRLFASGITAFLVRPGYAEVLTIVQGQGILVPLLSGTPRRLTAAAQRHAGFQFSPKGRFLSYVRAGDLYVLEISSGLEQRISHDGGATVQSGLADFIAQEEMHRFEGHWWHPEETCIAFQRTDERSIPVTHRHDIDANEIRVIEQRYPYAGGPNADIRLGLFELDSGATRWLDYQQQNDDYLARVQWLDAELWVQIQDRLQQSLTLAHYAAGTNKPQLVLEERSQSWINLHDNLLALPDGQFSWTSERSGLQHLYVGQLNQDDQGAMLQALTEGQAHVTQVHNFSANRLWFSGWLSTPTEQHLYYCEYTERNWSKPVQVTQEPGWHQSVVSKQGAWRLDLHSNLQQSPVLSRHGSVESSVQVLLPDQLAEAHAYSVYLPQHQTPELGSLTAADGQTLHYRLTRPGNVVGQIPVIVSVYGGPGVQRVRNEWAPLLLQLLVRAGFAVFELDNRGSGGRGREFEAGIYQALGSVEVADQLLGVNYLRTLDWVDPSAIGVFGHSYGGFMTLKCLLAAPEVFAAGVSVAPVTDWALYDTHYTERYLGLPQVEAEVYTRSGVLGHCAGLTQPLLLMHGMADDNVLFANTTALLAELQSELLPFSLMTYPGSKHALQEPHVAIHRYEMILDFFQQHLLK